MIAKHILLWGASLLVMSCGCTSRSTSSQAAASADRTEETAAIEAPRFEADSAYRYVKAQVDFGPRVPGTEAHRQCSGWIVSELKRHGADTVTLQRGDVRIFNGKTVPACNIMATFSPENADRILIAAHYDSRPWADSDPDESNHLTPVPGANDGASGVGVMLELARLIGTQRPEVGVDLLFVDAEDSGDSGAGSEESWCLGTQMWTRHLPYSRSDLPRFGIVLDMVGGTDARFHREYFSDRYASKIVDKVWGMAARQGLGSRFVNSTGGSIIDDHLFINRAGIPCIDIVESCNAVTGSFPPTWHTLGDNMGAISRSTLGDVGQIVTNVLFSERKSE